MFRCSHAAALFIHGLYNLSRTDIECQWKKRKATNSLLPSVQEMFPPAKPAYRALLRDPTREERSELFQRLKNYGKFTGLYWLMSPEPQTQSKSLPVCYSRGCYFPRGISTVARPPRTTSVFSE